jgi:PIN domain nuclease of toxin-antitoxin system
MKLLLDTHSIIWFSENDPRLPENIKLIIEQPDTECWVSIASFWEIAIKVSLNKLQIQQSLSTFEKLLKTANINILQIEIKHTEELLNLPYHHKDPFDRILIAQALCEDFLIVTKDENFSAYSVKILW